MSLASRAARAGVLAGVVFAVVLVASPPVAAHGGAAEISVVDATSVEPTLVEFTVEVRFVLDGHPAVPATFVASGVGPDGAIVDAQNLEPSGEEGVYQVALEFPATGNWTITFQSSLPPGEIAYDLTVGGDVAPPTAQSDDTGEAPAASAPPGAGETATVTSEGSGPPLVLLAGLAGAALVGVLAVVFILRANRKGSTP